MGVGCVQWVRVGLVQDLGRDEASAFTASLPSTSQQVPDVDSLVEAGSSFGQKNPMNKNFKKTHLVKSNFINLNQ